MSGDTRYLERHGDQWRVVIKVSPKARPALGCSHLKRGLGTNSLANANRLKWDVVAELKKQVKDAELRADAKARGVVDPLVAEAMEWRDQIAEEVRNEDTFNSAERVPLVDMISDRAEELEKTEGFRRASLFAEIASGKATPLLTLVDAWLAEANVSPRTQADYRRAVERFAAWSAASKLAGTIEGTTRKVAGRFIAEAFIATKTDPKTTNKYVSAASAYWRWLVKRGHAIENPWSNQSVAKRADNRVREDRRKRPFSDDEVRALLDGRPLDPARAPPKWRHNAGAWRALPDVMLIAALSGMRIEEIAGLTIADCQDGVFNIRIAKTEAGRRKVPIHSLLADTITPALRQEKRRRLPDRRTQDA